MKKTLSVKLDSNLDNRLESIANKKGGSKEFFCQEKTGRPSS